MILAGAGVGGGSLNYANTLYEPSERFYADPQWGLVKNDSHDLAVVVLDKAVRDAIPYELPKAAALEAPDVASQTFTNVGYGYAGLVQAGRVDKDVRHPKARVHRIERSGGQELFPDPLDFARVARPRPHHPSTLTRLISL